jgi:choline dehydrogenase
LLEKSTKYGVQATGVQYSVRATNLKIQARKNVILSAGSIGSQILELSGIGNPSTLPKYRIEVTVANENVGENLKDHTYVTIG